MLLSFKVDYIETLAQCLCSQTVLKESFKSFMQGKNFRKWGVPEHTGIWPGNPCAQALAVGVAWVGGRWTSRLRPLSLGRQEQLPERVSDAVTVLGHR